MRRYTITSDELAMAVIGAAIGAVVSFGIWLIQDLHDLAEVEEIPEAQAEQVREVRAAKREARRAIPVGKSHEPKPAPKEVD